jgi:peptidoglycan/xylan/chitin deacetylase (PgdA/CDA1 family)
MDFIGSNFSIIPLNAIKEAMTEQGLPRKVVITFDDAFSDFQEFAYPVLEKFKIPSTVFVPTGFIGGFNDWDFPFHKCHKKSVMSAKQLQELHKTKLVDIGSHSVDHLPMNKLNVAEIRHQLAVSKRTLEDLLSTSVNMFSYPYGRLRDFSSLTTKILSEMGYEIGVTALWGTQNSVRDILRLRRIYLREKDNDKTIRAKIEGRHDWIPMLKEKVMLGILAFNRIMGSRLNI